MSLEEDEQRRRMLEVRPETRGSIWLCNMKAVGRRSDIKPTSWRFITREVFWVRLSGERIDNSKPQEAGLKK